jgi:hypothetical protein
MEFSLSILPRNKLDNGVFMGRKENGSVCLIYRRKVG